MTLITFQDGKVVFKDGKVGTEIGCCCENGECSEDSQCCVCLADSFYIDMNGNPLDCAGLGPGWQNNGGIIGSCVFVGSESFPCPQPIFGEEWLDRVFWCNQQYSEAAAIDSFEPTPIGHCCNGTCQTGECDEAPPP